MWYNKHLQRLRRALKLAKFQQQHLLTLELEGFVALTFHTATQTLVIPIERTTGAQVVDTMLEYLRDRRHKLQGEACQVRKDWIESEVLRSRTKIEN